MSANEHPQFFVIVGHINLFNGHTKRLDTPFVVDHLPHDPRIMPIYHVKGDGLDYLNCKICFPNAGELEDNRRAPGA